MKITKAVIPCGGLGTRFLPVTKALPKELLPIIDTPAVAHIVHEAVKSGITDIMIVISPAKEAIKSYFCRDKRLEDALIAAGKTAEAEQIAAIHKSANIVFAYQNEPKGSGDAVLKAKAFVGKEAFCLAWGDDIIYEGEGNPPVMAQLISAHSRLENENSHIVGVQYLGGDSITKYGVAVLEAQPAEGKLMRCRGFKEKPPLNAIPSRFAALGRYLVSHEIFDELLVTPLGKNGELQLTDAINSLCSKSSVFAYDFIGKRYDTGDRLGYIQAVVEYGLRREFGSDLREYLHTLLGR